MEVNENSSTASSQGAVMAAVQKTTNAAAVESYSSDTRVVGCGKGAQFVANPSQNATFEYFADDVTTEMSTSQQGGAMTSAPSSLIAQQPYPTSTGVSVMSNTPGSNQHTPCQVQGDDEKPQTSTTVENNAGIQRQVKFLSIYHTLHNVMII